MLRRAAAALVSAAVSALAFSSCLPPPKPGDSCSDASVACFDPKTALECLGGIRVGVHCGGPRGCFGSASTLYCDQSEAAENDLCLAIGIERFGDAACSADQKTLLRCSGGRFVKRSDCRGPGGCAHVGNSVGCDASIGEPGEACEGQGAACTVDGQKKVGCRGGHLVVTAACEGDQHCQRKDHTIHCDERRGTPGAACTASAACSLDGSTLLECRGGAWTEVSPCRGPDGCTVADTTIGCDTSVAVVGEGCEGRGASCAKDGKTILQCSSGKWSVERACPKACEVRKSEHVVACK